MLIIKKKIHKQKDTGKLKKIQRRARNVIKGLASLIYIEEGLNYKALLGTLGLAFCSEG